MWKTSQTDDFPGPVPIIHSSMKLAGFYDALAEADETNPRWDELVAGMAVLRVVESAVSGDERSAAVIHDRARGYVQRVREVTRRHTLVAIMDVATPMVRGDETQLSILAGRMMAYGLRLHADASFAPAIDVFATVEALSERDPDVLMQAIQRRAFALRCLQRFDDAADAYRHLTAIAARCASPTAPVMVLEAELGLGKVLIERGNLPAAEEAVQAVRHRAEQLGATTVLTKALIDLAAIAGIRRRPAASIAYDREALGIVADPQERERLLFNMAHAFRELSRPQPARRIALHVAGRSALAEHRAHAQLLLYHLAIDDSDWPRADAYRSALRDMHLSPRLGAEYYETVSRHYAAIGATDPALMMLQRMLEVAEEHRLAELTIRAEQSMADVRRGIVPSVYEFRPLERIPKKARAAVLEAERSLAGLLERTGV